MFLHLLSENEKRVFAAAADHLIAADQVLHELEIQLRDSLAVEMSIDWPSVQGADWKEVRGDLQQLPTDLSRRVVMLELCGVAFADMEVDPAEFELLADICAALGLSDYEMEACLAFAPRAHALHMEGQQLILGASAQISS